MIAETKNATQSTHGRWTATRVKVDNETRDGWECRECGLLVAGAPVRQRPGRCPVCVARMGKAVALVAAEDTSRLSMLVIDRRLLELIDEYVAAKEEHERQTVAQALVHQLGNYEIDDGGISADIEASSSREQRAGLALADATARRRSQSRNSRPSLA